LLTCCTLTAQIKPPQPSPVPARPQSPKPAPRPTTPANPRALVKVCWDGTETVLARIDDRQALMGGGDCAELELRVQTALKVSVEMPRKTVMASETLLLDKSGGELHLRIQEAEDVLKFSYESAVSKKEREAREAEAVDEAENKKKEILENLKRNMVYVKGGNFNMGCNHDYGVSCWDFEKPSHSVTLNDYWMGKYEVTQAEWEAVMGSNPSGNLGDYIPTPLDFWVGTSKHQCMDCPVEQVSWEDAQLFIEKLNALTGGNYRLPTEAEWEYAARGGTQRTSSYLYSGGSALASTGWYSENANGKTQAVGLKNANQLGLFDMSGNVWEWCSDWYGDNYYANSPLQNPKGPSYGTYKMLRGGSWNDKPDYCRVSYRLRSTPQVKHNNVGLRLVSSSGTILSKNQPTDRDKVIEQIKQNMVLIEGGTFMMGCTAEQGNDCDDDEKPSHQVKVSSYRIGKYEVTQAEWEAVIGVNPSSQKNCSNCPVEAISWNDVQLFIQKLNDLTNSKYRLPTEAEWEFAARGGISGGGLKYSGSNNLGDVAWFDENSGRQTHPVGQKRPNSLGLYDMSGNVSEWCSDWYDEKYYNSSPSQNPQGPYSGSRRVLRDGAWINSFSWEYGRVSSRRHCPPEFKENFIGFRLAAPGS
jgi:formylglycine-generating enzyme required for sulfatase activity